MLCQALFQWIKEEEWTETHEKLEDVTRKMGLKKRLGRGLLVNEGGLEEDIETFFSAQIEQQRAFTGDRLLRESPFKP